MLTPEERTQLSEQLQSSARELHDTVHNLTSAQWQSRIDDDSWTVAGIAEHLVATEAAILQRIEGELLASAAIPARTEQMLLKDQLLAERIPQRTGRRMAPPHLHPAQRWATSGELLAAFDEQRQRT